MKRIMACIDFSGVTHHVMETATELARAAGAKLFITHVVIAPAPPAPPAPPEFPAPPAQMTYGEPMIHVLLDDVGRRVREARTRLDAMRRLLNVEGIDAVTLILEGNMVAALLREEADRIAPDLLVLGSHGHGRLKREFMGSTSQEMVRQARWPVVVIPSSKVMIAQERGQTIRA